MELRKGWHYLTELQTNRPNVIPAIDFHLHTTWTDGRNSVAEMHQAAIERGLKAVLFSEHARSTSEEWFFDYVDEVKALPASPCRAFVGAEVKILDFEGNLDITPRMALSCDLLMMSVHRFPGEVGDIRGNAGPPPEDAVELEFKLSVAAIKRRAGDILGHPFGMSYKRFRTAPPEELVKALIALAYEHQVAFEINPHYHPNPRRLLEWCINQGTIVSFGSNAHTCEAVGTVQKSFLGEEPQ